MAAERKKIIPLVVMLLCLAAQVTAQPEHVLTAQDLLDIRQIIDAYPRILDHCTNNGNDYADLFSDDATFGVASQWDGPVKIWFRGHSHQ